MEAYRTAERKYAETRQLTSGTGTRGMFYLEPALKVWQSAYEALSEEERGTVSKPPQNANIDPVTTFDLRGVLY